MIEVARRYFFNARHYISGAPQPWCNPHWHEYTVEVVVAGEPDSLGFVVDTDKLDHKWVQELMPKFKNQDLTETLPFMTSVENIASYLLDEFNATRVTVWEDDNRWGRATW